MMLEAVWLKNGKEVATVSPVMCIVCDEDMDDILDIEIEDGYGDWHSCAEADDFIIRLKKV